MKISTAEPLDRSMSRSETLDISRILAQAAAGKIRVPAFQRAFVWDASDVRRLFDSIYRGFPVGTLLLWKQPAEPGVVSFGPVRIQAPKDDVLWVVDGQQRVTSLVATFLQEPGADERFEVFFDLSRQQFIGPKRGAVPARSIPVREVLESRRLIAWLREHGEDLEAEDYELADVLGGALRDYRIPIYVVEGDNESLLREVFDRVNSAGKPITRAQVFHALFASETEAGSPSMVVEGLRRHAFGQIDEGRVVQTLLAIRGGDVQRDIHEEFGEDEDPAEWYDRTEEALGRAIIFLKDSGVPHIRLAPSTFPLPVLGAFFHLHRDPAPWVLRLLSRWLWRGFVHGFGGRDGGQTPALRRAVRTINPRKMASSHDAPTEYEAVLALLEFVEDQPAPSTTMQPFRTDTAISRLLLLALASLNPRTPDGQLLDVPNVLNERGVAAIGDLVRSGRSNPASRGFWLDSWGYMTGLEDREFLLSHGVTEQAAQALATGDVHSFLGLRQEYLDELTTNFLDSRLEPGGLARPPLSELVVEDPEAR